MCFLFDDIVRFMKLCENWSVLGLVVIISWRWLIIIEFVDYLFNYVVSYNLYKFYWISYYIICIYWECFVRYVYMNFLKVSFCFLGDFFIFFVLFGIWVCNVLVKCLGLYVFNRYGVRSSVYNYLYFFLFSYLNIKLGVGLLLGF